MAALLGAALSGCGGNDDGSSDPVLQEAGTSASADVGDTTNSTEGTNAEEIGTAISGSFRGVPDEQYTAEVSYSLEELDAEVQVADVPPGEAIVAASAEGDVAIANTTPERNTMIGTPHMYITLLYEEGTVPAAAVNGKTQLTAGGWYDTCQVILGLVGGPVGSAAQPV